ncbi:hypothetical protein Tco_0420703 [Tanacetum coccineum]
MNQNLYNSSGLDQFQPPQYSVVHQPPQETNMEMLQARENLMEALRDILKKYDQIPYEEKCIALLRAEEKFLKVKQALEEDQNQPEIIQESLLQLIHDLQLLNEIQPKQAGRNEPKDSLIMEDEDINTIPKKESGKDNESSAKNLVQNPSESEATFDLFLILMVILPLVNILVITSHFLRKTFSLNLPFDFDIESISMDIYPLLEELAGELALINPIPPGIAGANFDPEEDSSLVEKLLYDNSIS